MYAPRTRKTTVIEQGQAFCGQPLCYHSPTQGYVDPQACWSINDGDYYRELDVELQLESVFNSVYASEITTLSVGCLHASWSHQDVLEALVENYDSLPSLTNIIIGDLQADHTSVTESHLCDISELLEAFPNLEVLVARGLGLSINDVVRHTKLKHLAYQTIGGDFESPYILKQLSACSFPALEHLEIWLSGEEWQEVLANITFPKLKYLGIRNAYDMDDFVKTVLFNSPQLTTLDTLDLSSGVLTSDGALSLIESPRLGNLRALDLNHCYVTPQNLPKLKQCPFTVALDHQRSPSNLEQNHKRSHVQFY